MIANGALMAFLPLYGVSAGLNPGEVGLLFTFQAGTSFVSKPIMGRVSMDLTTFDVSQVPESSAVPGALVPTIWKPCRTSGLVMRKVTGRPLNHSASLQKA